jgi:restriction endonuclease S subunit
MKTLLDEQQRIVAYLDGLQAKVNALRERWLRRKQSKPQSVSGEELSPSLRYGDGSQSALMPSILDKAFKGELC